MLITIDTLSFRHAIFSLTPLPFFFPSLLFHDVALRLMPPSFIFFAANEASSLMMLHRHRFRFAFSPY